MSPFHTFTGFPKKNQQYVWESINILKMFKQTVGEIMYSKYDFGFDCKGIRLF